jgi:lathosterol oxidase
LFIFDKRTMNHPKFIKNQIWLEIKQANQSMPFMALCTAPLMALEVRGYSKLYDTVDQGPGLWYTVAQFPIFLLFTDLCIYWIHRYLHHPLIYKRLHKPHHKWIMPTPYASHAFHPLDGFSQSLPYHIFPFIFPLQKMAYVVLFVFVNFWSILIHDGEYMTNNPIVNGAACHSRMPEAWMFEREKKMSEKQWKTESKTVDSFVKEIEGTDERTYEPVADKKNK